MSEETEEMDNEFTPNVEEEDDDDVDIDIDIDDDEDERESDDEADQKDDDFAAAEEAVPTRRKPRGGRKDDGVLVAADPEQMVRANPKRQNRQQKLARTIEGVLDTAQLGTEEGAAKAWATLRSQSNGVKPRKYSLKDEFTVNDVIKHPKFGEGYVVEILTSSKIGVLFEDGVKRLAHNRS
jgi:hypothetical protein